MEPVSDSSRYFVLRLQDPSGKLAQILEAGWCPGNEADCGLGMRLRVGRSGNEAESGEVWE